MSKFSLLLFAHFSSNFAIFNSEKGQFHQPNAIKCKCVNIWQIAEKAPFFFTNISVESSLYSFGYTFGPIVSFAVIC